MHGLWLATSLYGLAGAIGTVVALSAVERVLVAYRVARRLHVRWPDLEPLSDLRRLLGAATSAGVATAVLRQSLAGLGPGTAFVSSGLVFGATYVALGHAWQIFTPGERRAMLGVVAWRELVRSK
jgi:hypothetical protein